MPSATCQKQLLHYPTESVRTEIALRVIMRYVHVLGDLAAPPTDAGVFGFMVTTAERLESSYFRHVVSEGPQEAASWARTVRLTYIHTPQVDCAPISEVRPLKEVVRLWSKGSSSTVEVTPTPWNRLISHTHKMFGALRDKRC